MLGVPFYAQLFVQGAQPLKPRQGVSRVGMAGLRIDLEMGCLVNGPARGGIFGVGNPGQEQGRYHKGGQSHDHIFGEYLFRPLH